jgi:hypothetical protein
MIMKRRAMWLMGGALAAAVLATVAAVPGFSAEEPATTSGPGVCRNDASSPGKTSMIATAKLIIEYNATDNDLGVHGAFDDQGWSELCVFDPHGRPIAAVDPLSQLNDLTMAGIFFESREPPGEEFSMPDLKAAFPEGRYRVQGKSFDGTTLIGRAWFTHDVPAPPTITSPEIAEDPKGAAQNPVSVNDLEVGWDQVTETVDGRPVVITGYEVIITKEVKDDPHGFSRPTDNVHVSASVNRLSVPAEFLESNTVYELEVLALEKSGNQTISVGFFKTV